jgi:8-oxo-dGTP pyrophosphatase MutT (NUDIX family)
VVVFLARRDRSELLVLQRISALGGFWHGVAGGVEAGEDWQAACLRELHEETGLHGDAARVGDSVQMTYTIAGEDERGDDSSMSIVVDCVIVDVADGFEPVLNWEHATHRWCSPPEALGALFWPNVRDALRTLLKTDAVPVLPEFARANDGAPATAQARSKRQLSADEFRNVIGRFASGVSVITTNDRGKAYGTTASALSSRGRPGPGASSPRASPLPRNGPSTRAAAG